MTSKGIGKSIEKTLESTIWNSRLVLIIGVIACVLTGFSLVLLGGSDVFHLLKKIAIFIFNIDSELNRDSIVLSVVEILDTFLMASILFIFSFGLYGLFIKSIDRADQHSSGAYQIKTIDELKSKLGKSIVLLLIVKVFALLIEFKPQTMDELLKFAIIVLLVAVSLWLGRATH